MLREYEKYQLEWMIEHGYSLEDLMDKIANIINEELTIPGNAHVFINEAFDVFEKEQGFHGEIWACEEEWTEHEAKVNDMRNSIDELHELIADEKIFKDMLEWFGDHDQASEDFMKKYGYNLNENDEYIKEDMIR